MTDEKRSGRVKNLKKIEGSREVRRGHVFEKKMPLADWMALSVMSQKFFHTFFQLLLRNITVGQ